jgi:hypothetical protein
MRVAQGIYEKAGVPAFNSGGKGSQTAAKMVNKFFRKRGVNESDIRSGAKGYRGVALIA